MTQENVIRMAREAHKKLVTEVYVGHMGKLNPWMMEFSYIFAKLVAEHEREACAKVFDAMASQMVEDMEPSTAVAWVRSKAAEIRARGEQA